MGCLFYLVYKRLLRGIPKATTRPIPIPIKADIGWLNTSSDTKYPSTPANSPNNRFIESPYCFIKMVVIP